MRLVRAAAVVSWVVAVGLAVPVGAAWAEAPSAQGWWTVANPHSSIGALLTPDVPSSGLLVEGGPSSPTAYAALAYQLPVGEAASSLTLTVAPSSATTPDVALELCPLAQSTFVAKEGGPLSDAPSYDCSRHATASPSANGSSYQFAVSSLVSHGTVAVAILPTGVTDRVVLAEPGAASLSLRPISNPAAVAEPPSLAPSGAQVPPPVGLAGPVPDAASPAPPAESPAVPAPAPSAAVVAPTRQGSAGAAAGSIAPRPVAAAEGPVRGANPLRVAMVVFAIIVGAGVWSEAGRAAVLAVAGKQTNVGTGKELG